MLDYLNLSYLNHNPKLVYKEWDYLKNNIHYYNRRVIDQSYHFPYWVPSNHILHQFITTIGVDYHLDAFDYYDAIKERALFVSTDFGMTSPLSKGIIHQGAFYGNGKEILIAYSGTYRPSQLENQWDDLSPVRVLRHGYNSLDFQPIVKADKDSSTSLTVILIDVVQLMFQYRGFRLKEELLREIHPDRDTITIGSFLSRYPLNHMRYSHNDYVLFNLLQESQESFVKRSRFLPIAIPDFQRQIDRLKEDVVQKTSTNLWDFTKVLQHTPSVYQNHVLSNMVFKGHSINRQNFFAYFYSIIPYLIYGLLMSSKSMSNDNKDYLSVNSTHLSLLKRVITQLESDGILNSSHLHYVKRQIKTEFEYLKDIVYGRL